MSEDTSDGFEWVSDDEEGDDGHPETETSTATEAESMDPPQPEESTGAGETEVPDKPDRETPLSDLAERVRDRDIDSEEDLFVEADVPQVDTEAVWEQLETDEPTSPDEEDHEPEVRVVEKDSYCETCPYFDSPPEMRCTHEGTEIRKLVDFEHVEVYNCPIVRQNEALENS